jgi:hypothetical protein
MSVNYTDIFTGVGGNVTKQVGYRCKLLVKIVYEIVRKYLVFLIQLHFFKKLIYSKSYRNFAVLREVPRCLWYLGPML